MSVRTVEEAPPLAPEVRGLTGLGPVLELRRDTLGLYERAHREHGDMARLVIGPPGLRLQVHLVMHPEGVRHVLAGHGRDYGKDSPVYQELRAVFGNGLLASQDTDWERQKRLLQPLFTARTVAGYAGVVVEEAEALAAGWRREAAAGRPVDLHAGCTSFALRTIGRVLFGGSLEDVVAPLEHSFDPLQHYVVARGLSPARLPRAWPTPSALRTAAHRRELYAAVDTVVARRAAAGPGAGDLVSVLLAARDPADGSALSREEIRDQVLIFLLAGYETTALALTYAFHLLGRHPAAQGPVRAESAGLDDPVHALPAAQRVVSEAMRLYPPACHIGRSARRDDVVLGHRVRAGDPVALPTWVVHRDPRWWPDPLRFDPDRFRAEDTAGRHRYAYLPFGGGPRACIGSHLSLLESSTAVATVLRDLAVTDAAPLPRLYPGITLRPTGPVTARLTPR